MNRSVATALAVVTLVLASCGQAAAPAAFAPPSAASATAAFSGTARRIDVVLSDTAVTPGSFDVQTGERVLIVAKNVGREKHNLVALTGASFVSPDAAPGQTLELLWSAPPVAQVIKVVCAYHPTLYFTFAVK